MLSLGSSNFMEIVTKPDEVVDKTLFIKTIIEEAPSKILLTAPRYFGKSTNLDMVKRFLEIEVDDKGKPKDIFKTSNYKLFKKNNLKINRDKQFINKHLGKHPVMFIDYKPLGKIYSFDSMLASLKNIQWKTFLQHMYLLNVDNLWKNDLNITIFKKYFDTGLDYAVDQSSIMHGFKLLSKVLHRHFGKQIFVLIDEYDAFVGSLIFKENSDMDRIISFIKGVNANILTFNKYVDRAVLTGVLPVTGEGLSVSGNSIVDYSFLGDHSFCKYYGLTEIELDEVLRKFVQVEDERNRTKTTIVDYYKGYSTLKHNITIYSIWTVLNFLHHESAATTYWCRPDDLEKYTSFFSIQRFKDKILKLLSGNCLQANISQPLSKNNLITLKNALVQNNAEMNSSSPALFILLFYHLGYLTINNNKNIEESCLKIPNREVSYELAKILTKTYISYLKFNFQNIYFLHSAIDSIHKNAFDHRIFENFFKAIKTLYIYGEEKSLAENEYHRVLFTFLVLEFRHTYSQVYKSIQCKFKDIFTINRYGVAFFIEIENEKPNEIKSTREIAQRAFNKTIKREFDIYVDSTFKDQISGKVFVGICFGLNKKLNIAYSYFFQDDDDIKNPKLIPSQIM